jgi:hypothetical protein
MHIEGTVRANLLAAIASARRWRGRGVHQDTIRYWDELLDHARHQAASKPTAESIDDLLIELETRLVELKQ